MRHTSIAIPPAQAAITKAALNAARSSNQIAEEWPVQIGATYSKWNQTVAIAAAAQLNASTQIAVRRVGHQQQSPSNPMATIGAKAANI